jgi:hypothetical protein
MAHATASVHEHLLPGSTRMKTYVLSSDASTTTVTIAPGKGYGVAIGSFKSYTLVSTSLNTFHFSLTAAPARKKFTISFLE